MSFPLAQAMPGHPTPEYDGLPCVNHGCSKCCYEAEMPLLESDMQRLESLGHERGQFAVLDDEAVPQLRMVDGHCYFLNSARRCGVHEARPEGCRLYPQVWDAYTGRVRRDEFCPFSHEFPDDSDVAKRVEGVLAQLGSEAATRRRHGHVEGDAAPKP